MTTTPDLIARREAASKLVHDAMRWAADNSCTDKHPKWEGGNSFAEDKARDTLDAILTTLEASDADTVREERQSDKALFELIERMWARYPKDEEPDEGWSDEVQDVMELLGWNHTLYNMSHPSKEDVEARDLIRRSAALIKPAEHEAVFYLRVGGDHTQLTTHAGKHADPQACLSAAIKALAAEAGDAAKCPAHPKPEPVETRTMTITLTEREQEALERLMAEQELSKPQVFRCALRAYQADHERRKAGETVTWSGDAQRAREFAGPLAVETQPEASRSPAVLPCDVKLPPATTIRAGCSLDTLLLALSVEGRPRHFENTPSPQPQAPSEERAREVLAEELGGLGLGMMPLSKQRRAAIIRAMIRFATDTQPDHSSDVRNMVVQPVAGGGE